MLDQAIHQSDIIIRYKIAKAAEEFKQRPIDSPLALSESVDKFYDDIKESNLPNRLIIAIDQIQLAAYRFSCSHASSYQEWARNHAAFIRRIPSATRRMFRRLS